MYSNNSFRFKIENIQEKKKTNLILALDPKFGTPGLPNYISTLIEELSDYLCAIKLNFHVILPLSESELKAVARIAHKNQVQLIADLKINDIFDTNRVIIQNLAHMGFDCAIVNPFIGRSSLLKLVDYAHSVEFGIIALVYMSHPDAVEGYGASILQSQPSSDANSSLPFYDVFYANALEAGVDGVVIGGNRLDILREFTQNGQTKIPIYSPGIITQGGNLDDAMKAGSTYLIIGRAIIESQDPVSTLKSIQQSILHKF